MAKETKQNTDQKPVDPEKVARKNAKKEKRKGALDALKNGIAKIVDEKLKASLNDALMVIKPSLYGVTRGGGGGGTAAHTLFSNKFVKIGDNLDEMAVFNEFKAGRKECASYIKKGLRSAEPKNRKWISFDPKAGKYTLQKIGEKEPQGWNGYRPVDIAVEDLK